MGPTARLVTALGHSMFVMRHPKTGNLTGICVNLWEKIATDLNLTYSMDVVDEYWLMFPHFAANKSDVMMERVDDSQMILNNITKFGFQNGHP